MGRVLRFSLVEVVATDVGNLHKSPPDRTTKCESPYHHRYVSDAGVVILGL